MHVKRWATLGFLGLAIFLVGMGVLQQAHAIDSKPLTVRVAEWIAAQLRADIRPATLGLILILLGTTLCLIALAYLIRSLTSALDPAVTANGLAELVYERRKLAQGRHIVVLGGGTGLSTMLRGLKRYTSNITAIVTVSDDGGSSGKLMKQLNILPPGDIRNCLVALADAEPQMMELFQYRFGKSVHPEGSTDPTGNTPGSAHGNTSGVNYGEGLRDHAFGNLLIAAMCAINNGDFKKAIRETSRVLNICGQVLPSTVAPVRLRAEMENGSILEGETAIVHSPLRVKRVQLVPDEVAPVPEALTAIAGADVIVLGPGSVYTSIIPNLLVCGIAEALSRSRAKKVYVCNVMTQPGETDSFTAFEHIRAIEAHARRRVFDYVLVNNGMPGPEMLEKYRKTGAILVEPDTDRMKAAHYRPITGNFVNQTDVVRHDAGKLAEAIMHLLD